jgi:Uma2 family endonuclease
MATDIRTEAKALDAGRRPYRFTAAQFWRMIEANVFTDTTHVELVAGRIYRMTKHEPHNFTVRRTARLLQAILPQGCYARKEESMRHDRLSVLEPDVAVVPGSEDEFRPEPPTTSEAALIVEVCASTRTADYRDKVRLYASAGVPCYWVVDVDARKIEVFTEPRGTGREAGYARRATFAEAEPAPVVIDGREVGRIAAKDLLPPA